MIDYQILKKDVVQFFVFQLIRVDFTLFLCPSFFKKMKIMNF